MRIEVHAGCLVRRFGAADGPLVLCVHGFADDGTVFTPLGTTGAPLSLAAIDLPGFGASPAVPTPGVEALAAALSYVAASLSDRPVGLMAHSMGAAVAVTAAERAPGRFGALLSLEGNLTAADAWLSGRATRHDDPHEFHRVFCDAVWRRAAQDHGRRRVACATFAADAGTLWALGRDVAARGDGPGRAYAALGLPRLYAFDRASTPAETVHFLEAQGLAAHAFEGVGHMAPFDAPLEVAAIATRFFTGR